jgi:hypothetical protein
MKHEIIYTEHYALIVSNEETKHGDFFISSQFFKPTLEKYIDPYNQSSITKKVIAHRPLTDAPILGFIPVLPSFSWSQQDDVDELAETEYYEQSKSLEDSLVDPIFDTSRFLVAGFKDGYNKAKETYKYTEEDLINFSNFVTTNLMEHSDSNGFYIGVRKVLELFKQIQKPKRPKYFTIKTTNMNLDEIREQGKGFLHANTDKPVIITNSQGQRELVGTYEGGEQ